MQKTIWYGVKDNNVAFANNQNALVEAGATNPQSFTTSGNVSGLNLIDDSDNNAQSQTTSQTQA